MRVVHIVPALFGPDGIVGGAERYAFELARHMATRVPTTLVTFGERNRHETVGSLEVRVLGNPWYVRGQRTNPFHPRLFTALGGAEIVHCHQQHVVMSSAAACGVASVAGAFSSASSAVADGTSLRMSPPTAGFTAICTSATTVAAFIGTGISRPRT